MIGISVGLLLIATLVVVVIGTLVAGVIILLRVNVVVGIVLLTIAVLITGVFVVPLFMTTRTSPDAAFKAAFNRPPGRGIDEIQSGNDSERLYLRFRATEAALRGLAVKPLVASPVDECRAHFKESKEPPGWFHPAITRESRCYIAKPFEHNWAALLWNPQTRETHYVYFGAD